MPYSIISNGAIRRQMEALQGRARDLEPATRKFGEWIARVARRRAPRGRGGRAKSLQASLECLFPHHDTAILASDKPYAMVQQYGGTILPVKGRLLAIPLNDKARKMIGGMGASVSLKAQNLTLIRTKSGKLLLARTYKYKKMRLSKAERSLARRRGIRTRLRQKKPEFLFVLKESVTLRPNPPPHGYAPRFREPLVLANASRFLRQHLRGAG